MNKVGHPFTGSLSKWLHLPALSWSEAISQELFWSSLDNIQFWTSLLNLKIILSDFTRKLGADLSSYFFSSTLRPAKQADARNKECSPWLPRGCKVTGTCLLGWVSTGSQNLEQNWDWNQAPLLWERPFQPAGDLLCQRASLTAVKSSLCTLHIM